MSFSDPGGGGGGAGGLEVGTIFARVGALFEPQGWERQQRAADRARTAAEKPIVQRVVTHADEGPLNRWKQKIDTARTEARRPIEARARMHVDETGFRTAKARMAESSAGIRTLDRDADGLVGKLSGLGFGLARFTGSVVGMLVAFGGFEVIKKGTERLGEMERTAAITEARLKSTGNAARVTAGHIDQLANSLFRKTGVDHETIASGENLLLTFTHVRNEVGRHRDVFDRATKAALNLSVGTGRDLTSSVRALGLALDNPEKGMTRLTRAGIIFTDQQKAQIKQLLASGNLYQAQNLILQQVEKRFGGTADAVGKTMPAALSRARVAWKDLEAELAQKAAPVIRDVANWFVHLLDQVKHNTGAGKDLRAVVKGVGDVISGTVGVVKDLAHQFQGSSAAARDLRGAAVALIVGFAGFSILKDIRGLVVDLRGAWIGLTAVWEASPFGLILAGAAAVTVALQAMGLKWQGFGNFVDGVWKIIKQDVGAVVNAITGWIHQHQKDLGSIGHSVSDIASKFANLGTSLGHFLSHSGLLNTVKNTLGDIVGALVHVVAWVLRLVDSKPGLIALATAAGGLAAILTPLIAAMAVEKVTQFAGSILNLAGAFRQSAINAAAFLKASATGNLSAARTAWTGIFHPTAAAAGGAGGGVAGAEKALTGGGITGIRGAGIFSEANPGVVTVMSGQIAGLGNASSAAEKETASTVGQRKNLQGPVPPGAMPGYAAAEEPAAVGRLSRLTGALTTVSGRLFGALGIFGIGAGVSQIAGSAIGGKGGHEVGSLGTGAAGGAAIGSLFGPGGAIGGAVGGALGVVLAGLFKPGKSWIQHATEDAAKWGNKLAGEVTKGMPAAFRDAAQRGLARSLGSGRLQAQEAQRAQRQAQPTPTSGGRFGIQPRGSQQRAAQDAAGYAIQSEQSYIRAGQQAAQAWFKGFNSVKYKSAGGVIDSMTAHLRNLPKTARNQAALTSLELAAGMEAKGQLPKGSMAKILKSVEGQFPGLKAYLHQAGINSVTDLANSFKLDQAKKNLQGAINDIQGNFGLMEGDTKVTSDNMAQQFGTAMKILQQNADQSSGKTRAAMLAEWQKLHDQSLHYFSDMADQTGHYFGQIARSAGKNSNTARVDASTAFSTLQANIQGAIESGAITTSKGWTLIAKASNKLLKAFGAGQIPVPDPITVGMLAARGINQAGAAANSRLVNKREGGFLGYEGAQAPDRRLVLAADGEAFLTGHDQPEVNRAMSIAHRVDPEGQPHGSLGHMFASSRRVPHYAGGGWVRTGATIDPTQGQAPTYSAHGGMSFAELLEAGPNAGMRPDLTQLLGLPRSNFGAPMETAIDARMPGSKHSYQMWKNDVGSGQPGNPHFTVDLHQAIANALHWTPNQDIEVARAGTDPNASVSATGGGGSGGGATQLDIPHLKGKGLLTKLGNQVLQKIGGAANKFLASKAPAQTATGGGGGAGPVAPPPKGPLPPPVQKALFAAEKIAGEHIPYMTGGFGWADVAQNLGLDCSGYVSTVMNYANLMSGYLITGNLKHWGLPGDGKYITVGVRGADAGPGGHTMMAIDGKYFESSGHFAGGGPHVDSGWSEDFPIRRHPPGLAQGGRISPDTGGKHPQLSQRDLEKLRAGDKNVLLKYNPHLARWAGWKNWKPQSFKSGGIHTHHGKSTAPKGHRGHAKGTPKISDRILSIITKTNPKLAKDLHSLNKYSTDITDLNARYDRTQTEQGNADKQYGDQVPPAIVRKQTQALVDIKHKIGSDLISENKSAQKVQTFLDDWLPRRTQLEKTTAGDIQADESILTRLHGELTSTSRRAADQSKEAARRKSIAALQQRLGTLRSSHGKTKTTKTPRYDPYGNKLPSTSTTSTKDNSAEIRSVQQRLAALGAAGGGPSAATRAKRGIQDQITKLNARIKKEKAQDSNLKKELSALDSIKTLLGDSANPDTGLPGQIKDNTDEIAGLTSALPGGEGGQDYTILPDDEQAQLDRINLGLSIAQNETGSQQILDERYLFTALENLWRGRVAELQKEGAPATAIEDAENNLNQATGQLTGIDYTALSSDEQARLDLINYAIAQAGGLPADKQQAAEVPLYHQLADFWRGRITELGAEGAPLSALTDAQGNLNQALQGAAGGGGGQSADASAVQAQDQQKIQNLTALNASAQAALKAFGGPGDIGAGGSYSAYAAAALNPGYGASGGAYQPVPTGAQVFAKRGAAQVAAGIPIATPGGGIHPVVVQHFESLHPADPNVRAQIATATVNALGTQKYTPATRASVL